MAGELTIVLNEKDLAHVQKQLSMLENVEQQRVVQQGLQDGVRVFREEGKRTLKNSMSRDAWNVTMRNRMAKRRGGSLYKAISTKVIKRKGKGYAGFGKNGHHAHLVDSGTKNRWKSNGEYTGSVKGSRFWRKAFDNKKQEAARILMESIRISIQRLTR